MAYPLTANLWLDYIYSITGCGETELSDNDPWKVGMTERDGTTGRRRSGGDREARAARRDLRISVSVTPEEREAIRRKARLCGMQVSPYLRQLGLGHPVRTRSSQELHDALYQLTRVGGLMERFLRAVEGAGLPAALGEQLDKAVAEAREAFGRLRR